MTTIDRRTVLKGLFGGAVCSVALPPLEAMLNTNGTAWASGEIFPNRFGLWTWANGVLPDRWVPKAAGSGDDWALSDQMAPLANVKRKLAVVTGTEIRAVNSIPHYSGIGPLLTGITQIGTEGDHTYAGPTLDQIIAAEIGGLTPFRSVETSARYSEGLSHNGPYAPNPPERDAAALYQRLFGPTFREPGDDSVPPDPRLALRRSVLDVVKDRIDELQGKLGQADKDRLDQHLTGIRDLELRLARLQEGPPDLEACVRPDAPVLIEDDDDLIGKSRVLNDLMVYALACDQTRVFSHVFMPPVGNYQFPGTNEGHHQLTHNEPGDQPTVHANTLTAIGELARFLEALDAIPEGEGTLLDHCAILGTTDVSLGRTHAIDEWPMVIAGSAGGALKNDVHYRSGTGELATKVSLSLIRAMGITAPSFGIEEHAVTDGISAIEV